MPRQTAAWLAMTEGAQGRIATPVCGLARNDRGMVSPVPSCANPLRTMLDCAHATRFMATRIHSVQCCAVAVRYDSFPSLCSSVLFLFVALQRHRTEQQCRRHSIHRLLETPQRHCTTLRFHGSTGQFLRFANQAPLCICKSTQRLTFPRLLGSKPRHCHPRHSISKLCPCSATHGFRRIPSPVPRSSSLCRLKSVRTNTVPLPGDPKRAVAIPWLFHAIRFHAAALPRGPVLGRRKSRPCYAPATQCSSLSLPRVAVPLRRTPSSADASRIEAIPMPSDPEPRPVSAMRSLPRPRMVTKA